jgi:hypothetical protein
MKSGIKQIFVVFLFGIITIGISVGWVTHSATIPNNLIRAAVSKSIPPLETSCNTFITKKQCSSCHHGSMTSIVIELARQKGITIVDSFAKTRKRANDITLERACNPNIVGDFLNVKLITPYILLGMAAEKTPPDLNTDIAVAFIMSEINADGSFPGEFLRAPMEIGQVHVTSLCIRAIQLYASPALKPKVDKMVSATKSWLENVMPANQQELAFQLMGLQWCGSNKEIKTRVANRLMELQRFDGGWAQLPSMNSDAYATGEALYALYESGMAQPTDEKIQRALQFLLKSQTSGGVWFVEARSYIIQPFVNTDFPINDENQFISAAATSWATMALLKSLPDNSN